MKTPTAILLGFFMVAVAIVTGPILQQSIVTPANAQGLHSMDYRMISNGFSEVASAIKMAATQCQR